MPFLIISRRYVSRGDDFDARGLAMQSCVHFGSGR